MLKVENQNFFLIKKIFIFLTFFLKETNSQNHSIQIKLHQNDFFFTKNYSPFLNPSIKVSNFNVKNYENVNNFFFNKIRFKRSERSLQNDIINLKNETFISNTQINSKENFKNISKETLKNDSKEIFKNKEILKTKNYDESQNVLYDNKNEKVLKTKRNLTRIKPINRYKYGVYERGEIKKNSPNRLNRDTNFVSWFNLVKLIFILILCTAGTTGIIFVISSIIVIDTFQVQGNIYLVSLSLSQLLISVFAIPGTCIEIMAVTPNHPQICDFQWVLTQFTLIITCLSFMLISIENCSALSTKSSINHNIFCSKFRIIFLTFTCWIVAGLIVYTQYQNQLAPALCLNKLPNTKVWNKFHLSVGIGLILLPTLITIACFFRCVFRIKVINTQLQINPLESSWNLIVADGDLVKANIIVYIFTFLTWLPLCIMAPLSIYKEISIEWLNAAWWISWTYSCCYCFVYAIFNQNFGKTFFKLFYYCCCKSHVQFEGKNSMSLRRNCNNFPSNNFELKVHIIPGLNMNQRKDDSHYTSETNLNAYSSNYSSNKNNRYGTVNVGRHTRTIPASDNGLGFGGSHFTAHNNPKWNIRVESNDENSKSSYNKYSSRKNSFSSHLHQNKNFNSSQFSYNNSSNRNDWYTNNNNYKYYLPDNSIGNL